MHSTEHLTAEQMQVLQERVDAVKSDPNVTRVAAILRSAPLESDEFNQAIRSAEEYGPSAEICAIWALAGDTVPDSSTDIVQEIMEDTYVDRMVRIHASKMTAAIVRYYNTPPK